MSLGDLIRQARTTKGLSQRELARRVGVSNGAVSQWESGAARPEPENLFALKLEIDLDLGAAVAGDGPQRGEFVEDPDELALLSFWRSLKQPAERQLVLRMLWAAKARPSAA